MTSLPTYDEVLELPAVITREVPEEYLDENDHMNIGRYLELASRAAWAVTTEIGMGQAYIDERRLTTFTVEHHLRYFSELRLGDELSVHVRLLERSAKALHSITFIVDRTRRQVAFSCELVIIHVGMDSRRPTDFPQDKAAALDGLIAEHNAVDWPAPVCGAMGIRRS